MCRQNVVALHLILPFNYTHGVKSAKTNREDGEQYKDLQQDTWWQIKAVCLYRTGLLSLFGVISHKNTNEDNRFH